MITNANTREYVVSLLEHYQSDSSKMDALRYELNNPSRVTTDEMIEAMNFGHSESSGGGISKGHVSNKTLYIAANYMDRTISANTEAYEEISALLHEMESERDRLLHYISLLDQKDREMIYATYIETKTREELSESMGVSLKSVSIMRRHAIKNLCNLYDFTAKYRQ